MQLYREEARYLDRTVHWVHRVGMEYVKEKVVANADNRKALYARLRFAVADYQDPWAERASGAVAKEDFFALTA